MQRVEGMYGWLNKSDTVPIRSQVFLVARGMPCGSMTSQLSLQSKIECVAQWVAQLATRVARELAS